MKSRLKLRSFHALQSGAGIPRAVQFTLLVIVLGLLMFMVGRKLYFDYQVRQFCANDGGVRVYEKVPLSAERFDQWGLVDLYRPELGENALGKEYLLKLETRYYRRGNPEVSREQYQVIRKADGTVLGESVIYGRGGGDLPGPSFDSSFRCPASLEGEPNTLLKAVFINSAK